MVPHFVSALPMRFTLQTLNLFITCLIDLVILFLMPVNVFWCSRPQRRSAQRSSATCLSTLSTKVPVVIEIFALKDDPDGSQGNSISVPSSVFLGYEGHCFFHINRCQVVVNNQALEVWGDRIIYLQHGDYVLLRVPFEMDEADKNVLVIPQRCCSCLVFHLGPLNHFVSHHSEHVLLAALIASLMNLFFNEMAL